MSQTSPLYAINPNVKTQISVTAQANRIRVVNDSSLYLRVYFGADAPILATDPGWHDTISPGDKPLLWITGGTGQTWWAQSGNPSSTPFTGVITFLPFFPVGATLAGGGVVSGSSILYITAFSPDENAERGGQTEAFVQSAKQGRYQSVEGGTQLYEAISTEATTALALRTLIPFAALTTIGAPNIFAADAAGLNPRLNAYLYAYHVTLRTLGPQTAFVDFSLSVQVYDSTLTINRGGITIGRFQLQATNFQTDHDDFSSPVGMLYPVQILNGTLVSGDFLCFGIANNVTPKGDFELTQSVQIGLDRINQSPLYTMPGFSNIPFAVMPPPATYNPQTY